jgi:hypothetical protein
MKQAIGTEWAFQGRDCGANEKGKRNRISILDGMERGRACPDVENEIILGD